MKIAIPAQGDNVNQHFGRSEAFAVYEIAEGKALDGKLISAAGFQHQHGRLAGLLTSEGVTVVIAGGMGQGAKDSLKALNIEVLTGAQGKHADVAQAYAKGEFVSTQTVCSHHGEHHHHHHE